jgi:glycosyltransferase involved in cell wall biosynthesis
MIKKKAVYYWSPFLTKIATIKAVTNSAETLANYSDKYSPTIINAVGEFDFYEEKNRKISIDKLLLQKTIKTKFLPKEGFIKSRFSFWIIFLISIFPLFKVLKKNNPTFLVIHLISSLPLVLLFFFDFKTKFILRISGLPKLNFIRRSLWKLTSNKLYKITCPTQETLDHIKTLNIFDEEKLVLLRDPIINIKKFGKAKKAGNEMNNSKKFILAVGRLTKQKNFEFLIECFQIINSKYKDINLIILGEGERRKKLIKLIKKYNLENQVFLKGHADNVNDYFKKCEAFILSSLWEDPGFVLVEAAFNNCNIISSDCKSGPKEILKNGEGGHLFKSNSVRSFVKVFDNFFNQKKDLLLKKKIIAKKNIKQFTSFRHYIRLKEILDSHGTS